MNNDSQLEEKKWALKQATILFNVVHSVAMSIWHSFSQQYHLRDTGRKVTEKLHVRRLKVFKINNLLGFFSPKTLIFHKGD